MPPSPAFKPVIPHGVPEVNRGHRTLAAIVLTDAVGFSARMSQDEELTLTLIQRDQQLMQQLCQQFEGQVLKSTGDGLLLYFVSAVQAVTCALEIQKELTRINGDMEPNKVLLHRIGVHLGDVFFSQSDVMGNGVNIAARLQTEAQPGGICISQVVYDVVKSRLALNATFAGPLQLKNIQEAVPAYHLVQTGAQPEQTPAPALVPTASRDRLNSGIRVGGRYTVQRVLGQGGFGRSYLVEDTQRFGEPCVLKEFFPASKSARSLQKALDLFKREAKTLYQLNHPQVPKFLACFTQGQRLFIVQEYIDGVTYSQLLRQRKQQGQRFSETEVTQWLVQMLQVLDHLHQLKIVHRDISPDNIIYSRDRQLPVLIDFGLVNNTVSNLLVGGDEDESDEEDKDEAKPATMVGKFGYSPPEQMHLGQCYPCSDLYALGVTALVLLTGKYPRELMDRDSLEWRWQAHVTLSRPLTNVLNRLTRQKPRERYQSAWEVMQALSDLSAYTSPLPQARTIPVPVGQGFAAIPAGIDSAPDHSLTRLPTRLSDPAFIEQCRQALTRCIGPMASLVIEDALDQHPEATPEELVDLLAAQISDGQQMTDFVSRITLPEPTGETPSSNPISSGTHPRAPISQDRPSIAPEFLQRCRQELTRCIGPMAEYVIEETLADYPNLDAQNLVFRLAAEIPDARKAAEFQQKLK
ncbi:protein kinase [Pseudanabaena sp. FACHB-2040]|uniref:protein kinase domain-containing protein n=1 Tax=Pseudanabaena sp. FACHB-2040 TaxID=2692859 RepID=UPI001682A206|nr:protein kinase [Pseudanabaena sp. FACHB-2040]MBD2259098.1 protein kinase [Pseudanabaena sp. FACHB-2040]